MLVPTIVIALKCPEIQVTVVDSSIEKINNWNSKDLDELPVFEPGLSKVIAKTRNKNLFFTNNLADSINDAEMIFMAVNTPTKLKEKGKDCC